MATNPMQRKSRISFILGMLLMLLICGAIIVFLFLQLNNYQKKEKDEQQASVRVYTLNQDVSSGQVITDDMYTIFTINKNLVPSNAIGDMSIITNYSLQDKAGNSVYTKNSKLYIQIGSNEYELIQEEGSSNYYIQRNNQKEYIELNTVPLVAKIALKANTVLTREMLAKGENSFANDVRREEYNTFILPMDLTTGDYVDIRLMLPTGQNYIVVSKKEVEVPIINGAESADTIWMNVSEDEILTISSAIVDAYRIEGSKLYATKYTEAGMQQAATPTYVVSSETASLMNKDPNILKKAIDELINRYNSIGSTDIRNNYINRAVEASQNADEKYKTNMEDSIKNTQNARKQYLNSLGN
ncbi:MAG: hypothetical protein IJH76_03550 [Clostridia bacterium]|nr:hypothetical protein [Clostridia bacterium]